MRAGIRVQIKAAAALGSKKGPIALRRVYAGLQRHEHLLKRTVIHTLDYLGYHKTSGGREFLGKLAADQHEHDKIKVTATRLLERSVKEHAAEAKLVGSTAPLWRLHRSLRPS